jgi:hypothetical protein
MRSSSEPPEDVIFSPKTGLRGGFPIKIAGQALGSRDSLQEVRQEGQIFGPRIRSRRNSSIAQDGEEEVETRRKIRLRSSTPVKIGGVEFTTSSTKGELLPTTPFGPSKARYAVGKKENTMRKHSTIHNHNLGKTNEVETKDSIINEPYSEVTNKNIEKPTVGKVKEDIVVDCDQYMLNKTRKEEAKSQISQHIINCMEHAKDSIGDENKDNIPESRNKKENDTTKVSIVRNI